MLPYVLGYASLLVRLLTRVLLTQIKSRDCWVKELSEKSSLRKLFDLGAARKLASPSRSRSCELSVPLDQSLVVILTKFPSNRSRAVPKYQEAAKTEIRVLQQLKSQDPEGKM